MIKYEVGQKLWLDTTGRWNQSGVVTVTAVGRKWAQLDGGKYRVELGKTDADGGEYCSPGRLYISKEACEQRKSLAREWHEFTRFISGMRMPVWMTVERIEQLKSLLSHEAKP